MYSILCVDDEPDVLDITRLFLEETGNFRVETGTSAKRMLDSSAIPKYDAVITDYQMPGMNGIEFLKEIRNRYGDIPVLIFTGHGREDIVIEAINNGADFYVQKGGDPSAQYTELGHKTLQAILKRRAERSLENFYKVFTTVPVGLLLLNEDLVIQQASKTMMTMVLREPAEVIGERAGAGLGCIHSHDVPQGCGFSNLCPDCPLRNGIRGVIATGESVREKILCLTLLVHGKPLERWLRVSAEPVSLDNSRYVIVAVDDVTDLVEAKARLQVSEERFRKIFNNLDDAIYLYEIRDDGKPWSVLEVNDVACAMLQYKREELLERRLLDFVAGSQEPSLDWVESALRTRDHVTFRTGIVRKDGSSLPVEIHAHVLSLAGKKVVLSIIHDTSGRKSTPDAILV
ncbi:MAG: response regulator [Methanoregulaceae archaeon]